MASWRKGEAEMELLLARHELERVAATRANGMPLLEKARKTAATAATLVQRDADSAFVLAYPRLVAETATPAEALQAVEKLSA